MKGKKNKAELYKAFFTSSSIPAHYEIAFLCDMLKMSYYELMQQPDFWVHDMTDFYDIKAKVEEAEMKSQKAQSARQNTRR